MAEQIFRYKLFNEINADMRARFIALQDKITDLNEGSVTSSLIETTATEISDLYMRAKTGFDRYLKQLAYTVFGFERKNGLYAAGAVVYARETATPEAVVVPIGSELSTPSGLKFLTTGTGSIPVDGTVSGAIAVRANETGIEYNVPAETVTTMITTIPGATSVSNLAAMSGGQDEESDTEYSMRFKDYLLGLGGGNKSGIIAATKAIDGVRSATLVEHFPPLDSLYNFSLYVDDGAGQAPEALVNEVETTLFGDGETPGKIAAGVNARILAPTVVVVDIEVELESTGMFPNEIVMFNVETALREYINGIELGDDVVVNKLRAVIMRTSGIYDFSLTVPDANILIGENQIARFGTATITMAE